MSKSWGDAGMKINKINQAINKAIKELSQNGKLEPRHAANVTLIAGYELSGEAITTQELINAVDERFAELGIK
jgi:hypothetical protein